MDVLELGLFQFVFQYCCDRVSACDHAQVCLVDFGDVRRVSLTMQRVQCSVGCHTWFVRHSTTHPKVSRIQHHDLLSPVCFTYYAQTMFDVIGACIPVHV
jgi:3-hydroxyisobutyrate dehydrogenase-like beta-hydroxyacid dehydrogenase